MTSSFQPAAETALQITEIFFSIQGESSWAGLPCVFVRLTGCNLRCSWCDTEYSFHGGRRMSLSAVLEEVRRHPASLVELTGGEPLLQAPALAALARELLRARYTVLVETSGERDISVLPPGVVRIMDVKCPGSGESGRFRMENIDLLTSGDEVKFVLRDRADYEFARDFMRRHDLARRAGQVLFSPAFFKDARGRRDAANCELDPRLLAEWVLADGLPVRLALQMHKFIWDPSDHGV